MVGGEKSNGSLALLNFQGTYLLCWNAGSNFTAKNRMAPTITPGTYYETNPNACKTATHCSIMASGLALENAFRLQELGQSWGSTRPNKIHWSSKGRKRCCSDKTPPPHAADGFAKSDSGHIVDETAALFPVEIAPE